MSILSHFKNNNYINIIIPTMWRVKNFIGVIEKYVNCNFINKIIIIDNDESRRPKLPEFFFKKLEIINYKKNIYVNASWNKGFLKCTSDIICISNDDISIDDMLFEIILNFDWIKHDIHIIGTNLQENINLIQFNKIMIDKTKSLGSQYPTFGCCMFISRYKYVLIPDELKIWFGDDFLVHSCSNIYLMTSPFIAGSMSTTITSINHNIKSIIEQDIAWAQQYLLHK